MKKSLAILFVMIFCCTFLWAAAETTQETMTAVEVHAQYFVFPNDAVTVPALIQAAENALDQGVAPEQVGQALVEAAEEAELLDFLTAVMQNNLTAQDPTTEAIRTYFQETKTACRGCIGRTPKSGNVSLNDVYKTSDALTALFADEKAAYCLETYIWPESGFDTVFGVPFAKFKPSTPRTGYACVVIKSGSKQEETTPIQEWTGEAGSTRKRMIEWSVVNTLSWMEETPIFTGNPNLASTFWVVDLQYPFYANYGTGNPPVKGHHCTLKLSVIDAKTHKPVAEMSATRKLGNTISSWSNNTALAYVPLFSEADGFDLFVRKLSDALRAEHAEAASARKMTALNAGRVLNGVLVQEAEKNQDPWQKAIYMAGAKDVVFSQDSITLSLRSFQPQWIEAEQSQYADKPIRGLKAALAHAAEFDLQLTLPVEDGQITKQGMTTLRGEVKKAAAAALKTFSGKDVTAALGTIFFPVPTTEKNVQADTLLHPDESFFNQITTNSCVLHNVDAEVWAPLFYGQKSVNVSVKNGPHNLTITSIGVDPEELLRETRKAMLHEQSFLTADERCTETAALKEKFWQTLAEKSILLRKNADYKCSFAFDLDSLIAGSHIPAYEDYLESYDCDGVFGYTASMIEKMPEQAALPEPKTGKLSGSSSGTQVTFKLTPDAESTYVQMRNAETDDIVVTCFIAAGKRASVNVPKGNYYVVWGSGPCWYGEELLFGQLGQYQKSELTEVLGSKYSHTITFSAVNDGNLGYHQAGLSDFQ